MKHYCDSIDISFLACAIRYKRCLYEKVLLTKFIHVNEIKNKRVGITKASLTTVRNTTKTNHYPSEQQQQSTLSLASTNIIKQNPKV